MRQLSKETNKICNDSHGVLEGEWRTLRLCLARSGRLCGWWMRGLEAVR